MDEPKGNINTNTKWYNSKASWGTRIMVSLLVLLAFGILSYFMFYVSDNMSAGLASCLNDGSDGLNCS